ncbi:hypothetical protein [Spirosoma taeanense]|nr:hypothetical protein [Spirosoma taeanense]
MSSKQRQSIPLQPIPADKKPYLIRGEADTLVYLTGAQAANRFDLIPQFERLADQYTGTGFIEMDRS